MENFITIKENVIVEITEKKSKFIANLIKVENKQDAEEKINKIKKTYHDARHNCVAYRIIEENKIIEKGKIKSGWKLYPILIKDYAAYAAVQGKGR